MAIEIGVREQWIEDLRTHPSLWRSLSSAYILPFRLVAIRGSLRLFLACTSFLHFCHLMLPCYHQTEGSMPISWSIVAII